MAILVGILAVVAAGFGVALVRLHGRRRAAEMGKEQAEVRVATLDAQALAAVTATNAAEARVTALETQARAAEEQTRRAEAQLAAVKAERDPRLVALWALAQLEQQRAWRLSLAAVIEGEPDGL